MKVKNEGNSDTMVLLGADASNDWSASAANYTSGAELISVPAFGEVEFEVTIIVGEDSMNGDDVPIVVTAKPLAEDDSWPDEYTA